MNTNFFLTVPAAQTGVTAGQAGVATQGQGLFSANGGLGFIDLLFSNINALESTGAGETALSDTPLDTTNFSAQEPQGTLLSIPGLKNFIQHKHAIKLSSTDLSLQDQTGNNDGHGGLSPLQILADYIQSLNTGLPTSAVINSDESDTTPNSKNADSSQDPLQNLVASGLSPRDLTDLVKAFKDLVRKGDLPADIETIKLIDPQELSSPDPAKTAEALFRIQEALQNKAESSSSRTDEFVAVLNALVRTWQNQDGSTDGSEIAETPLMSQLKGKSSLNLVKGDAPTSNATPAATAEDILTFGEESAEAEIELLKGRDNALSRLEENMEKIEGKGKKVPSGLENAAEKIASRQVGPVLSSIQSSGQGSVETQSQWNQIFPEGLDVTAPTLVEGKPLTGSITGFTSLVSHAPQAAQPHPATQSVAATISRMGTEGENKNFIIKLDPPELGRVEVRMSIDKDSKIKAHLIIEKPETYMMLQRDAHVLERSFQGLGLDSSDSGLSFELAQDNMFQNDGDRGGERYQSGRNETGTDPAREEMIESTMTWHVDPATGQQHYNILV
ncbi:MAG: flagellar hook-length control protein FliK [Micavibrio sp.]